MPSIISSSAALRTTLAALLLSAGLLLSSGCMAVAVAGATAAGVVWVRGALETNLDRDLGRVHDAAVSAVEDLEFALVSKRKSGVDGEVVARTALDKRVSITLKQVTQNTTKISIRVGLMGDEAMSQVILERIRKRL